MNNLLQHIEALIFSAEQPISIKEIKSTLINAFGVEHNKSIIEKHLKTLEVKYAAEEYSFELKALANGYQFLTKPEFHIGIRQFINQQSKKKLTRSALETLSIIAYQQPVSKSEISAIRGVDAGYGVQKLLEKELITIAGRSEGPGKPLLYGTSELFMNYFGIQNIQDLPKLKEFSTDDNEIGEANEAQVEQQ